MENWMKGKGEGSWEEGRKKQALSVYVWLTVCRGNDSLTEVTIVRGLGLVVVSQSLSSSFLSFMNTSLISRAHTVSTAPTVLPCCTTAPPPAPDGRGPLLAAPRCRPPCSGPLSSFSLCHVAAPIGAPPFPPCYPAPPRRLKSRRPLPFLTCSSRLRPSLSSSPPSPPPMRLSRWLPPPETPPPL
jgi:hypothetical protein